MGLVIMLFRRLHQAAIDARRKARAGRYLGWAVLSGLTAGLSIGCLLMLVTSLWAVGLWLLAIALLAVFLVPIVAPLVIRHVLVAHGYARAAHAAGRVATAAGTDPAAYALVAAAWAVTTPRRGDGAAVAWVQTQRDLRGALGDAEVVATALLAARSDVAAARALLASVPELVESHPAVRELAGEWLAVDAAERGAWAELLPDEAASWPASPLRFLLEGVAARALGHPAAPGPSGLWARWIVAPHRRHTWELVRRSAGAMGAARQMPSAPPAPDPRDHDGDQPTSQQHDAVTTSAGSGQGDDAQSLLAAAVTEHLRALQRAAGDGPSIGDDTAASAELAALVARWDRALGAGVVRDWLGQRATALGANPGAAERALGAIEATVVAELRAHVERRRVIVPPLPASRLGAALGARLRHGRLDEVELAFERWSSRVASGNKLCAADEWREFVTVRQGYRELVRSGGDDVRRLAFPRAFDAANRAAVVLWNQRAEYVLAHAILRWQLAEAHEVGDVAAIELAAKNCRLKVQSRTGEVG